MSKRAVEEERRRRLLWCLRVKDLEAPRAFHLATHKGRSRSPLADAFCVSLEAEVAYSIENRSDSREDRNQGDDVSKRYPMDPGRWTAS